MPTNPYGPGDTFDLQGAHVLPALIRKFHEASCVASMKSSAGARARRGASFCTLMDLAKACVFLMERYESGEPVNVGWGEDISIGELAGMGAQVVGFFGRLRFDTTKPDGTPRKLLDVARLRALGWAPEIQLRDGVAATYRWYVDHESERRG